MEYPIKVITGFREDQFVIIDVEEAHKAYYLFANPEERAIFSNGVALIGKNIQEIKPAWNEIMGWNPTHELDNDDWNEIRGRRVDVKVQKLLSEAKQVSYLIDGDKSLIGKALSECTIFLQSPNHQLSEEIKNLSDSKKV